MNVDQTVQLGDLVVAAFDWALVVVTPEKEVEPYEEVSVEQPPVQVAENRADQELLPQTTSDVPLYAGLGLLSLLGALGLGVLARRLA